MFMPDSIFCPKCNKQIILGKKKLTNRNLCSSCRSYFNKDEINEVIIKNEGSLEKYVKLSLSEELFFWVEKDFKAVFLKHK